MVEDEHRTLRFNLRPGLPGADASAWSVGRRLGRFRLESLLGEGGMGQVFEAWDPRLKRLVAIKLMHGGHSRMLERFVREAQAQASLSHPGICPVFEVGDVEGTPFIVMQRLYGRPLDEAADDLPLEAKLRLVRRVAEAVHEAHRAGLIHRDLKPANVIVETPEEGPPRPYVLDFGLARALGAELGEAMTAAGHVVGTPAYMAPEQVRGDAKALDGRTDVYGLGATLYCLVAGQPPFQSTGSDLLIDVLKSDPTRLPDVPEEVEVMIFKCLEKDPARRYPSAKAFAEDLQRYLAGETIHARPTSRGYRVAKWIRRHQPLAGALAALVLVVLGAIAWSVLAAERARDRQELVASFVEQVEKMQAEVRYSHMAPLHDTRPDRALLRQRMTHIRNQMTRHGTLGGGAGHFALGSGHLALEELESAHREFETAWAAGYRTPDTAAGLAQTLSAIYRERLSDLELVQDWSSRSRRRGELDEQYGDPARVYLEYSRSESSDPEPLLAALVHFHHGRFEQATAVLEASVGMRPWSYELPRLEAEIRRAWAIEKNVEGDLEGAEQELELALEALDQAVAVAESDPSIHRTVAQVIFQHSSYNASEQEVSEEQIEQGLAAAERALTANPDDARSWLWKARLHRLAGTGRQNRGEDPTHQLQLAVAGAQRATAGLYTAAPAWRELARAHWGLARWLQQRGDDPGERFARAAAALAKVPGPQREFYDEHLTAMIWQARAGFRASRGEDAAEDYEAAVAAYRAAIALHSSPFSAWVNLGSSALARAESQRDDAQSWLKEAVEAFEQAQPLRPQNGVPAYYLGRTYFRLAQSGDPASGLLNPALADQALASYRRALELAPAMFQAHIGSGEVYHHQALHAAAGNEDPTELFAQAREAYGRALELAPASQVARLNLAWTDYFDAKVRIRTGREPGSRLRRAMETSQAVFEATGEPWALLCLASAHRLEAEWRLDSNEAGRAGASTLEARRLLEQLLEIQPRHGEALRSLGRLETLEARRQRRLGQDPAPALEIARRWLHDALELAPQTADFHLAIARLELEAGGGEACARGLQAADHALRLRPGWTAAQEVRSLLDREPCPSRLRSPDRR